MVPKIPLPVSRPDVFGVTPCVKKIFGVPSMAGDQKHCGKVSKFRMISYFDLKLFKVAAKVFLMPNSGHIFNTTGTFCMGNDIPWK